jgi:hypothetical protein
VDHHEQGVVGHCAHEVRDGDYEPPRLIAQQEGQPSLQCHQAHRVPERHGVLADQLADLGVLLEDLLGAAAVRLGPV